jgi:hypothetical protein
MHIKTEEQGQDQKLGFLLIHLFDHVQPGG